MTTLPDSTAPARKEWGDPGYFVPRSRFINALRLVWQLIRPPKGHRTLPTKAGGLLILISLGIGSAAFNTSHNILYIALALLLSSLLLSGVLSWLNFKGCRWRLRVEPHLRAEEPYPVIIEVANTKKWLPSYGLWFKMRACRAEILAMVPQYGRIPPGGRVEMDWIYTPPSRGLETLSLAGVQSKYPFGFLKKSIEGTYEREIIVWPPRIEYSFSPSTTQESRRSGNWKSRAGAGSELINLREYRPGDPLRMVHWKASARRRKLLVRETAEEGEAAFTLILSSRASQWQDARQFERLCAFVATLAEDLFMEGKLAGVWLNGEGPQPIRRIADLHGFLSRLALLERVERVSASPLTLPGTVPLAFKPGSGATVTCWINGENVGQA